MFLWHMAKVSSRRLWQKLMFCVFLLLLRGIGLYEQFCKRQTTSRLFQLSTHFSSRCTHSPAKPRYSVCHETKRAMRLSSPGSHSEVPSNEQCKTKLQIAPSINLHSSFSLLTVMSHRENKELFSSDFGLSLSYFNHKKILSGINKVCIFR